MKLASSGDRRKSSVRRRTDLPSSPPGQARQDNSAPFSYAVHSIIAIMRSSPLCGFDGGARGCSRDFRRRLLSIIGPGCGRGREHRQEAVRGTEATSFDAWRRHGGQGFQLFCRVSAQVDLRALKCRVSEPE